MSEETLNAGSGGGSAVVDAGSASGAPINDLDSLAAALAEDQGGGAEGAGGSEAEGAGASEAGSTGDEAGGEAGAEAQAGAEAEAESQEQGAQKTPEELAAEEAEKAKQAEAEAEAKANEEAGADHPAFQKRIDQLVAQRNEAREANATHEAEVTQLREQLQASQARVSALESGGLQQAAVAQGVSPTLLLGSEQEVAAKRNELMNIRQFLQQNPDGATLPNGNELSAEEVAVWLASTEQELFVGLPEAERLIPQRKQYEQFASTVYPDYFGAASKGEGQRIVNALLQRAPGLVREANLPIMVGDMLAGSTLRALGVRPSQDGKSLVGKDGKVVWTPKAESGAGGAGGGKGAGGEAAAIVAEAVKERKKQLDAEAAAGGTGGVGGASTGVNARAGGGKSKSEAFVDAPSEEGLAALLAD